MWAFISAAVLVWSRGRELRVVEASIYVLGTSIAVLGIATSLMTAPNQFGGEAPPSVLFRIAGIYAALAGLGYVIWRWRLAAAHMHSSAESIDAPKSNRSKLSALVAVTAVAVLAYVIWLSLNPPPVVPFPTEQSCKTGVRPRIAGLLCRKGYNR